MLGAIIGDIVGSIYEGAPYRDTDFTFFSERGGYTDDTVDGEVYCAFREKLIPHWAELFFRAVLYYFPSGELFIREGKTWASLLEVLNAIKDDDISQIHDVYWRYGGNYN